MRRRECKVKIEWSGPFAYAIGLLTSDGNLSSDGRHINLTSKDLENIMNFRKCLNITNKIGRKARGEDQEKKYYLVQFGDINFYEFLNSIGITKAKSKTIKKVNVPAEFFRDFFRGFIDGDGSITLFRHPESKHMQVKLSLASASIEFLIWMKEMILTQFVITGGWISSDKGCYSLTYGKSDALKIIKFMYHKDARYFLKRKYLTSMRAGVVTVAEPVLGTGAERRGGSSPLPRTN